MIDKQALTSEKKNSREGVGGVCGEVNACAVETNVNHGQGGESTLTNLPSTIQRSPVSHRKNCNLRTKISISLHDILSKHKPSACKVQEQKKKKTCARVRAKKLRNVKNKTYVGAQVVPGKVLYSLKKTFICRMSLTHYIVGIFLPPFFLEEQAMRTL